MTVLLPLAVMPGAFVRPSGRWIGRLLSLLFPRRRRIALRNTALAYGRPRPEIVSASFAGMGISLVEAARIWLGREDVFRGVRFAGLENYLGQRAAGRPVILVTAHAGNWELMNNVAARRGIRVLTVVRPLDNPLLERVIRRIRSRYGNRTVSKWGALRPLLRELRSGGVVCILSDQGVMPEEGVITEFFGHPAYTIRTPALLAQKTGAALIPVFIRRIPGGHRLEFHPPLPVNRSADPEADIEADTRRLASVIEAHVRRDPGGWLWIHRRWKRAVPGA